RMIHAILRRDIGKVIRIDTLQATDVVTVLLRIRPSLVVGMDPAVGAEVVPGRVGIELIKLQVLGTLDHVQTAQRHGRDNRPLATAGGAIAAARVDDAVRKVRLQSHGTAMASGAMPALNGNTAYFRKFFGHALCRIFNANCQRNAKGNCCRDVIFTGFPSRDAGRNFQVWTAMRLAWANSGRVADSIRGSTTSPVTSMTKTTVALPVTQDSTN